ncbi:MAG TPA: MBL fold metallo-hydrolase [Acidimicrobiia bacterium]|nr:MBL fold metallo-hydrolase [Acidimicrobiia bacterium]
MPLLVRPAPLWFAVTNSWVVAAERGGPAVIIDAPPDVEGVARLVAELDVVPVALLVTHGHVDHVGGSGGVADRFSVSAYLHPDDDWLASDPAEQLRSLWGAMPPGDYAPPDRFEALADGTALDLAGLRFEVLHTPGHTPGHCCFHIADEGLLFSGDQLFAGSIGRTDLPGGSHAELMRSMADKIVPLDGPTEVLPGHGPTTTIARELAVNPFLQDLPR